LIKSIDIVIDMAARKREVLMGESGRLEVITMNDTRYRT